MNKWLFINGECLNLKRANRIFYDHRNDYGNWVLFVDYNDELIKLFVGNEKEIKRRFETIKEFLMSKRAEFMEME